MKNNISLTRIGYLLKHQIYTLKHELLSHLGGFTLGFIVFFVLGSISSWRISEPLSEKTCDHLGVMLCFLYVIFVCIAYSITFIGLETSVKRCSLLMLPSTTMEKYLTRLIIATVLGVVGALLSLVVADGLHMLIDWIVSGQEVHSLLPGFFDNLIPKYFTTFSTDDASVLSFTTEEGTINLGGIYPYTLTFFILCSSAFHKKAFIKGVGCYTFFNILAILAALVIIRFFIENINIDENFDTSSSYIIKGINAINVVLWLASVWNIWWSYRNFRKNTIV